jgi:hypothetical protein
MRIWLENDIGRTRVSRVQFGVPPNCVGARSFTFFKVHNENPCVPLVSGATPETTRQRRVLPTVIRNYQQA